MYRLLFVLAALAPLSLAQIVGEACANGAQLPSGVIVPHCDASPCDVTNGGLYEMEMTFTMPYASSSLTNVARAYVGGVDIGFELPADAIDACSHASISCPVAAGTVVNYEMAMIIDSPVTGTIATVQYEMYNQLGQIVVCFRSEVNVLKSVNSFFPKKIKNAQKTIPEDYSHNGSYHEAVGIILALAQCFGVMPVVGVTSKSPHDLKFQWKSLRVLYSLVFILNLAIMTILTIYWMFTKKVEFSKFVPIIFYGSNLYVTIAFFHLARKWPKLMKDWDEIEKNLQVLSQKHEKWALSYKVKILSFIIFCLSLIEHVLSQLQLTHAVNHCREIEDPMRAFFLVSLPQVFYIMEYNIFIATVALYFNVLATLTWSYMDLFVMLISIGLASRFKLVNDFMLQHKGKFMPEDFWIKQRRNYRNLCELLDKVDNAIAHITMLSFSNNLFFICNQLLNSMNDMPSFYQAFYFWFSLIYLILRTLAVSLYSADINDESKRPIEIFRAVPRESWCLEIKRFSEEVTNDVIALSGMKFFYLTRKLVLSVAGTIVTYELVLIQFRQESTMSDWGPCFSHNLTNSSQKIAQ